MNDEIKEKPLNPHAKIERDALIEADDWLQAAQCETRGDSRVGPIRDAIRKRINELDGIATKGTR